MSGLPKPSYRCPECGARFEVQSFLSDDDDRGLTLTIAHEHDGEPTWIAAIYRQVKGKRRPDLVQDIESIRVEQKRRLRPGPRARGRGPM